MSIGKAYEIPNIYIPKEFEKTCPVSTQIYNLFEKHLPCTGHLGVFVSTLLASMCTDEPKPVSAGIGAKVGEGKTTVLSKFAYLPNVNFFNRTTFADYLIRCCGWYFDITMPPGKEIPQGVEIKPSPAGGKVVSKLKAQDRINYTYDIIHAGEGIFTIGDLESLLQLWNGLIEEGYWAGGNRWVGFYRIGDAVSPVKHGLILSCTIADFENRLMKQIGFTDRLVLAWYSCLPVENQYIIAGRAPPKVHIQYVDFSPIVSQLLAHLQPWTTVIKVRFADDVDMKRIYPILQVHLQNKSMGSGKRAINDVIRLLKAHAVLNKRDIVTLDDVMWIQALSTMSRKVQAGQDEYLLGNRLDFQLMLRKYIYGEEIAKKQVQKMFVWWDSTKPLYNEETIKLHMKLINTPVNIPVPKEVQTMLGE
jgi:hypothetical protein